MSTYLHLKTKPPERCKVYYNLKKKKDGTATDYGIVPYLQVYCKEAHLNQHFNNQRNTFFSRNSSYSTFQVKDY